MRLGLDFDNTLVSYDRLFHRIAVENGWIPSSSAIRKQVVRDLMRAAGREGDWTRLQGVVYGARILEAEPPEGMTSTLESLAKRGIPMVIISHKTRTPYLGEPWDLHAAARGWLDKQGFHDSGRLGWSRGRVFFESTQDAKIDRILEQQCTHYVDDLPEILERLPDTVTKILFSQDERFGKSNAWQVMRRWQELPALLDHA